MGAVHCLAINFSFLETSGRTYGGHTLQGEELRASVRAHTGLFLEVPSVNV